jgi:hypothetical protein
MSLNQMSLKDLHTMVVSVTKRVRDEKENLERVKKEERKAELIEKFNKCFESINVRFEIIDRIEEGHNSYVISINELPCDCFNIENFTYEDLIFLCDYISENSEFTARGRYAVEGESYWGCNSFVIVLSWDID